MLTKPSVLARQLPGTQKFAVFAKVEIGEFQGEVVGLAGRGTDAWISAQYGLPGNRPGRRQHGGAGGGGSLAAGEAIAPA